MKSLKLLLIAIGAVAISATSAYASVHINGGNDTTGPNSENENSYEIDADSHVHVTNHADAENEFEVEVSTGGNGFGNNTQMDNISTGDIMGDIEFENDLNEMDIEFEVTDLGDISIDLANDTTGPQSENENEVEISLDQDVHIENLARIENEIELNANSGGNSVDHNTVVGDVSTGDIKFSADVSNEVNGSVSLDLASAAPSSDVSIDLSNGITGPNSENENEVDISSDSHLSVRNEARIENELEVQANTGNNSIDHNTVVGDISTGSINISFSSSNSAN